MSRLLPRYTQPVIHTDPLELAVAAHTAREEAARAHIAAGSHTPADPTDLRGIPCIARGVGGTSPGTDPMRATIRELSVRRMPHTSTRP